MCAHSHPRLAAMLLVAACCAIPAGSGAAAQQPVGCAVPEFTSQLIIVQDRSTRVRLAGATVIANWRSEGGGSARAVTDAEGRVLICAPPAAELTLQVAYHDVRARPQTLTTAGGPARTHLIEVDAPGMFVRGRVLDEATGAPIPNVRLSILHSPLTAISAANGSFELQRVPLGTHMIGAEHIAYAGITAPIQVQGTDLDAVIRLSPTAVSLDPLIVTTFSRRLDHVGFYERQQRGIGTFIDRRQIDGMRALSSSELLRHTGGVRLVPQTPGRSGARLDVSGRARCRFSFIVDGARTLTDFEMDFVAPYAIEGIEIYRGIAEVPAPFRAHVNRDATGASCGVIAIWTRDSR
jgi:hypothetical protein